MNVLLAASILLFLRFISFALLSIVVNRQWSLLRTNTTSDIKHVRIILLGLGIGGLIGQIVPALIDTQAILQYESGQTVHGLLLFYAFSNAVGSVVASGLLWYMYYLIEKQNIELGGDEKKTQKRR